jgi:beta-glucuronidase
MEEMLKLRVITRKDLPAYTLRGYSVRWLFYGYDDLPMDGKIELLQPLAPGSDTTLNAKFPAIKANRVVADILRPGGYSAATAQLTLP